MSDALQDPTLVIRMPFAYKERVVTFLAKAVPDIELAVDEAHTKST